MCLLCFLALPGGAAAERFGAWHGMNLVVTRGQRIERDLDHLRALGANAVALVPRCQQRGTNLTCEAAPSQRELKTMLAAARERRLRVMLKPHVETKEFEWRGELTFETEEEWTAWFANYERVMTRFAHTAPDAFVVGTELAKTTHREADWRRVIRSVREFYRGPLVYAAHHEEFERITWWDALDALGVDAYFPLAAQEGDTVDALVKAWRPYVARLERVAQKTGKPLLFTEAGYQSRVDAFETPWQKDPAIADLRAQAFAYAALFEAFEGRPWWRGALWWDWTGAGPDWSTDFTPALKPAEGVLLAHWRRP